MTAREVTAATSVWDWRFRCPGCGVVGELIPDQAMNNVRMECRECGWEGYARDGEAWPKGEGPPLGPKPPPWWHGLIRNIKEFFGREES